jgi:hypothetical protein
VKLASGLGIVCVGIGMVTAAFAQDAGVPGIFLKMTESPREVPVDTITRDDLRDLPPPHIDKLRDRPTVTVVVGDPRCQPGDDLRQQLGVRNLRSGRVR